MMEQAKLILEKCHGLPLLITTLGSFLASRPKNAIEWKKLYDHINMELQTNSNFVAVKTVLSSSYDGLPYHLKPCFLYMSISPKNHRIKQRCLVNRWIAEGYSREVHDKTAKETGESYFMELVSGSMIQPSTSIDGSSSNNGRIDFYQVHNLVREISMSRSEEENLVLVLDNDCSMNPQRKIQHLSISSSWSRDKHAMKMVADLSYTRSMTVFGKWQSFFISKKMRFLRVLDLEDTKGLQDQDLEPMGKLHHLKYLSLRGSRGVFQLPDSFGNLSSLETLDIRDTHVTKLPGSINKLQKLKYIRAGRVAPNDGSSAMKITDTPKELAVSFSQAYKRYAGKNVTSDQEVEDLEDFPSFCFRLGVMSKHRNVHGVQVPKGIKKLKHLHTLGVVNVNVSSGKALLKELKNLKQLRKLGATGISKGNSKELCSAISHLSHLESLSVRSEGKPGLEGCLDAISQPPRYLQSLKLYGSLATLPTWIDNQLFYLAKLNLRSTRLKYDAIPILGKLQNHRSTLMEEVV